MNFCLPKFVADKFIESLPNTQEGILDLINMTPQKRREFFSQSVGEANAKQVNAAFESKLVLPNVEAGLKKWIMEVTDNGSKERLDMLKKVNKLSEKLDEYDGDNYLEDFVNRKLGVSITEEEMGKLAHLGRNAEDAKQKLNNYIDERRNEITANLKLEQLEDADTIVMETLVKEWETKGTKYFNMSSEAGAHLQEFKKYVSALKEEQSLAIRDYARNPFRILKPIMDLTKSVAATLDNSFQLGQGFQLLSTGQYKIWGNMFLKSWNSFGKQIKAPNEYGFKDGTWKSISSFQKDIVLDAIKARAYSHPFAVNGYFAKAKMAIGIAAEESFPPSFLGRIPLAGRMVGASEAAYHGSAIYSRVQLGSKLILDAMKKNGGRLDNDTLADVGRITNSVTGRGSVPLTEQQSAWANQIFMSIRYVKSQYDILTGHTGTTSMKTSWGKKQAAINTIKNYASLATLILMAKAYDPESVDFKNHLGEIKIGDNWWSMPQTSMLKTASKIANFLNDKYVLDNDVKFGERTGQDIAYDFMEGKAAPVAAVIRDYMGGRTFQGEKPEFSNTIPRLGMPLPVQGALDVIDEETEDQILINALGFIGQRIRPD